MSYWCIYLIFLNTIVLESRANSDLTVINYENENDGMGNSKYRYTLSDGSTREEIVRVVNKDMEDEYPVIKGIYSYIMNAVEYRVSYVADINGFRPHVEAIPLLKNRIPTNNALAQCCSGRGAFGSLITTLQGGGIG